MDVEVALRVYDRMKQNSSRYYQEHKEEVLRKKREKYMESRKDAPVARRGRPPKDKGVAEGGSGGAENPA